MPVILYVPQDPADMVMAGEQMRVSVMEQPVSAGASLQGAAGITGFSSLVPDEDAFFPANSLVEGNRLSIRRQKNGELQVRANGGIATPCGAWLFLDYTPLLNPLLWASNLFALAGVTKDSAGSALGACRVVALETGRIEVDGMEASVGETISDGSGNYSIPAALNTAHQLIAYKPGAPDVAGITRNDVTPTHIG